MRLKITFDRWKVKGQTLAGIRDAVMMAIGFFYGLAMVMLVSTAEILVPILFISVPAIIGGLCLRMFEVDTTNSEKKEITPT